MRCCALTCWVLCASECRHPRVAAPVARRGEGTIARDGAASKVFHLLDKLLALYECRKMWHGSRVDKSSCAPQQEQWELFVQRRTTSRQLVPNFLQTRGRGGSQGSCQKFVRTVQKNNQVRSTH